MHLLKLEGGEGAKGPLAALNAKCTVMLGLPCHSGQLPAEVCISLYHEMLMAMHQGYAVYPVFYPRCSLIQLARNHLFSEFYSSHYDDLVFWDVDQTCAPGDLLRLLSHDADIVGGVARIKKDPEEYRLDWLDDDGRIMKENGLVEVAGMGACFLRVSKKAAVKIIADNPKLRYRDSTISGYAWDVFACKVEGERYWGEDMAFCHLARKAGFKIHLDPTLHFTHIGLHGWSGNIENYLKRETLPKERPVLQFSTEQLKGLLA